MTAEISRRKFAVETLAGATVAAAAGIGAGRTVEIPGKPLPDTRPGISSLNSMDKAAQIQFIRGLKTTVRELSHRVSGPELGKDTEQVVDGTELQPGVNTGTIVEAALLLAEAQYGAYGRDVITQTIAHNGLVIHFAGTPIPETLEERTPLVLTLPRQDEAANIQFKGVISGPDDFAALDSINTLVNNVVKPTLPDSVTTGSLPAQLGDGGMGIAGGVLATGALAAAVNEPISRRRFLGAGATIAGTTAAAFAGAELFNAGGSSLDLVNRYTGVTKGGTSLGESYGNPSETFKALITSEYFQRNIKDHLIEPKAA